MLLWFAALAVAGTFLVFRDAALDYRLVAVGAVIADPIDAVISPGKAGPMHTLVVPTLVLTGVMLSTVGRRRLRRRLLGLSIGLFAHLVLDGAWGLTQTFWWPGYGFSFSDRLPLLDRGIVMGLALEGVGLGVGYWLYGRFGLQSAALRSKFLRQGRLDRTVTR